MRLDFAYSCDCNRVVMDMFGFWPKYHSNILRKNWFLISATLIFIVIIIPRFAAMCLFWNEVDAVVQCFSTQVIFMTMIFRLMVMHFRNAALVDLLATMKEDCLKDLSTIQYAAVLKTAKIGRIIALFLIFSSNCTIVAGVIAMKLYHLDSLYIKKPDPRLSLDFFWVSYLPFSTETMMPYVLVLSLQFLASAITGFYFIFDGFVVMLILHICGQLKLIQISLKNLKDTLTRTKGKNLQMTLGSIMEQHQRVIRFAKNLDESFSLTWFLDLATCTLTFCFLGYIVQKLMHTDHSNIFQMGFPICSVSCVLIKFFLNCWAGEYLISQSSEIGYAFYDAEWYKLPPAEARLLMIIGHKRTRPITLTTGKFSTLSISLFVQVLKASASYLSMLLVVADQPDT
ncbi:odorant receptor 22c-like isoform X2 [Diachasmimorpha longicaudata]|uniref:odorant receptor 22c-like isoform X2 n=1 Tax=Diachasmimorpha longicaudata TaxID=58733 RepID=UPI0030B8EE73